MPRRKIIRIHAAELKCWDVLWEELGNHPLFQDANFDCIEIVSKQRNPDPRIIDVEMPIVRLERFIRNNGNRMVGKQKLCAIMKISRPTLNKWIDDEFISKGQHKEPWSWQHFDWETVASELKKQQNTI
jgi:hypothetical protein